jgi:hypothetical protein
VPTAELKNALNAEWKQLVPNTKSRHGKISRQLSAVTCQYGQLSVVSHSATIKLGIRVSLCLHD